MTENLYVPYWTVGHPWLGRNVRVTHKIESSKPVKLLKTQLEFCKKAISFYKSQEQTLSDKNEELKSDIERFEQTLQQRNNNYLCVYGKLEKTAPFLQRKYLETYREMLADLDSCRIKFSKDIQDLEVHVANVVQQIQSTRDDICSRRNYKVKQRPVAVVQLKWIEQTVQNIKHQCQVEQDDLEEFINHYLSLSHSEGKKQVDDYKMSIAQEFVKKCTLDEKMNKLYSDNAWMKLENKRHGNSIEYQEQEISRLQTLIKTIIELTPQERMISLRPYRQADPGPRFENFLLNIPRQQDPL